MLEELDLPYTIHEIYICKGDQFSPEYVAINPNRKIPAIIDRVGLR
jgi:GST-like protein